MTNCRKSAWVLVATICILSLLTSAAIATGNRTQVIWQAGGTAEPFQSWVDQSDMPTVPGIVRVRYVENLTVTCNPQTTVCYARSAKKVPPDWPRQNVLGAYAKGLRLISLDSSLVTSPDRLHLFYHELGHDTDSALSEGARLKYARLQDKGAYVIRNAGGSARRRRWNEDLTGNPVPLHGGYNHGVPLFEEFADNYALCARNAQTVSNPSANSYYLPPKGMHRTICRFIKRAVTN